MNRNAMQKILTVGFVAAVPFTQAAQRPATRPNVVFIYADDMDPAGLRCYGGNVLTPHIDRLAAEGVRFTRYYATSPVCSPSRYSLLTGRYASRCRALADAYSLDDSVMIRWNTFLEGKEQTVAHLFNDAGYVTGLVGKHHNIENTHYQSRVPEDADPRSPEIFRTMRKNYESLVNAVKETTGFNEVINLYANNFFMLDIPAELQQHNLDWTAEGAIGFIKRNRGKPFFLHIGLTAPHGGPEPIESIQEADLRISSHGYLSEAPDVMPSRQSLLVRVTEAGLPPKTAESTWIDDLVGSIRNTLEAEGLAGNTVIFFASDHNRLGKMTCYDDGTKTPAILWGLKTVSGGQVNDELVANIDLVPTVMDLCGITIPKEYPVDGKSWLPMVEGKQERVRENLLLEITYTKAVVSKNWKYIATRFPRAVQEKITPDNRSSMNQEGVTLTHDPFEGIVRARYGVSERFPGYYDDDQLYDLRADPNETNNLAYHPGSVRQLRTSQLTLRSLIPQGTHRFGEFQ